MAPPPHYPFLPSPYPRGGWAIAVRCGRTTPDEPKGGYNIRILMHNDSDSIITMIIIVIMIRRKWRRSADAPLRQGPGSPKHWPATGQRFLQMT